MSQTLIILIGIVASIVLGAVSNWIYDLLKGPVFPDKLTVKGMFVVVISALPLILLVALPQVIPREDESNVDVLAATIIANEDHRRSLAATAAAIETQQASITQSDANATQLANELANLRATSQVLATQAAEVQIQVRSTPTTESIKATKQIPITPTSELPTPLPTSALTTEPTPEIFSPVVSEGGTINLDNIPVTLSGSISDGEFSYYLENTGDSRVITLTMSAIANTEYCGVFISGDDGIIDAHDTRQRFLQAVGSSSTITRIVMIPNGSRAIKIFHHNCPKGESVSYTIVLSP